MRRPATVPGLSTPAVQLMSEVGGRPEVTVGRSNGAFDPIRTSRPDHGPLSGAACD
jgi:hypothetical protein